MSSDSTEKDLEDLPEDRAEMISMSRALEDIDADEFNEKLKEEAIKEAKREERQQILDKIEDMLDENEEKKDRLLPIADNAVHGELRATENTLKELHDELEEEVDQS